MRPMIELKLLIALFAKERSASSSSVASPRRKEGRVVNRRGETSDSPREEI